MTNFIPEIDVPALLLLILSAALCSGVGSILLLQRRAMIGDSLSHAVLPGLVVSYLLTHSLNPFWMISGAFISSLLSVAMIQVLQRGLRLDSGVAMGMTFTTFFALGIFLLEVGVGGDVHLDTHHVLYGALELSYWPDLSLSHIPNDIVAAAFAILTLCCVLSLVFKRFEVFLFDPDFAKVSGFNVHRLDTFILIAATLAIVLSFKALGAILVISLLICPAAAVRLRIKNIKTFMMASVALSVLIALTSYVAASFVPLWLGYAHSLHVGGVTACVCGATVVLSILLTLKPSNAGHASG